MNDDNLTGLTVLIIVGLVIVGQVPFVDDPKGVIELMKEEQAAQLNDAYAQAFNTQVDGNGEE